MNSYWQNQSISCLVPNLRQKEKFNDVPTIFSLNSVVSFLLSNCFSPLSISWFRFAYLSFVKMLNTISIFLFSNSFSRDQNECSSWAGFVLKALYTKPSLVMFFSFLRIRVSYCWVFRWILVSCLNPLSLYNISKLYLLIFYISHWWLLFPLLFKQIFEAWELMIFVESDVNMVHIRPENIFFMSLRSQKFRVRKSKAQASHEICSAVLFQDCNGDSSFWLTCWTHAPELSVHCMSQSSFQHPLPLENVSRCYHSNKKLQPLLAIILCNQRHLKGTFRLPLCKTVLKM